MIRRMLVLLMVVVLVSCVRFDGSGVTARGQEAASQPASRPAATRRAFRPTPLLCAFPPAPTGRPATTAPAGETEAIYRAALAWFDRATDMVDTLVPVAESAADRLLAGGTLWVGGNGGFADECDYRAGGFPFAKVWTGQQLERNDVLLVGHFRPNEVDNRFASIQHVARGYGRRFGNSGMTVHLSGHAWPQIQRFLPGVNQRHWRNRLSLVDTGAPVGGDMKALCIGQMSATALGWVLHGEIIAAATRRGKTLATYASDWEPDGRKWDASVRGKHEHPKYKVPPIPAGKIGRRYLRICRKQVADFLATQPKQVRLASQRMAACMKRGGMVWAVMSAHILPRGALVPRELTGIKMFGRSYDWRSYARRVPKGDLVLWIGYLRYPRGAAANARRRGHQMVTVSVDDGPTDERLTHIRGCWKDFDTVIDLPKYPIRVLPSSGVVQTPQWYALMAETMAATAARK